MDKKGLLKTSLINALLTVVYVFLVALLMWKSNEIFGKMNELVGPFAFLMLFVLSVAVVGSLIAAKPILMYLDGKKKEAVQLLLYTILWLFIATVIALAVQIATK